MPPLRLTLAQINPTLGDIDGNIQLMLEAAQHAFAEQSHLVIFPELSLTGYYPADLLNEEDFLEKIEQGIHTVREYTTKTPNLYWVIGAPIENEYTGQKLLNALLVIANGKIIYTYAKQLLPNYNIFNERRHFEPGQQPPQTLTIQQHTIGFLICEDSWNDHEKNYAINPLKQLTAQSPDLIISINASPSNLGKQQERLALFSAASKHYQCPIVFVNQIGGHDQLIFDGASFAVTPKIGLAFQASAFQQEWLTVDLEEKSTFSIRTTKPTPTEHTYKHPIEPALTPTQYMAFYREQILLGLKDYARKTGFKKVVVGSSGGIDSALTLALAVEALGKENVIAITMPSVYSSEGSVDDSAKLCQNLEIPLITHPIHTLVSTYQSAFEQATKTPLQGLALENLQARIRGTVLMEYSNQYGHLVLTTGNKSELSVGYCTLYGDTNGGLSLIGDLYKTEVFALSHFINERSKKEIIPLSIIEKEPSAELAPNQKDSDSLPPYALLDHILKYFIERDYLLQNERIEVLETIHALSKTTEGQKLLARIKHLMAKSEYKRKQTPPILRLRPRAFGSGRQMPICAKYEATIPL
jgi:NAD+ synthase (glutamine-hydrolysing)